MGIIKGTVSDTGNKVIEEVRVYFGKKSPAHNDMAAETNEDGFFYFDDLLAGTYELIFTREDYKVTKRDIQVSENSEILLNITLEKE